MSEPVLEVMDLRRNFGSIRAVDGVSFTLKKGQVAGFIGANGAGKTTTMRMIATLELPDSGLIRVGGFDVVQQPFEVKKILGWMPDAFGVYQDVTVLDYMDFHARACGLKGKERRKRLSDVMDFVELGELKDRPMSKLSKGQGQRLCFGRMLLNDPQVMIMDEPAAGLDPKARLEFKNLIRLLSGQGRTILISSHILSELGELCDALIFIDRGKIVHHGSAETLTRDVGGAVVISIEVEGDSAGLKEWLLLHEGWGTVRDSGRGVLAEFHSHDPGEIRRQLARMVNDGLAIVDFHRRERKLEEAFVQMIKDNGGSSDAGAAK